MAKGNRFKPNRIGYQAIMNSNNEVMSMGETQGHLLATSASSQSGIDYRVDSRTGLNRFHVRVSTVTSKDYYRERHYKALAIAVGMGGNAFFGAYGGEGGRSKGYKRKRRRK